VDLSDTILGHRIVAELHLGREDYEDAIKAAKHGLEALKQYQADSGKALIK
jgi:superkiller protein 3